MSTSPSRRADPRRRRAATVARRLRAAPGLALATAVLVGADVVWWFSSRPTPARARCAGGQAGTPVAVGLAAASALLVVASLCALLLDWVQQSVAGDRRLGRGRALTIVTAVCVLIGVVGSIAVMRLGRTVVICV